MYKLIVVPLDGSAADERALAWATLIAREAACRIHLVRIVAPPGYGPPTVGPVPPITALDPRDQTEAAAVLQHQADELAESAKLEVTADLAQGMVPGALESAIEKSSADIVVMSSHDHGLLERLLVSSVSESVVRHVHLPVLLVPETRTPAIQQIVVALDGSHYSEMILPHVRELALLMRAHVTLLTIIEPVATHSQEDAPSLSEEKRRLEIAAGRLRDNGLIVDTRAFAPESRIMVGKRVAAAIRHAAEQAQADVIALTTHGRSGVGRLVAGSVAREITRDRSNAVLVYRPQS